MSEKLKKLKEDRASIVTQMRAMHDGAEKEDRGLTADEQTKWDKMDADVDALDVRIAAVEKLELREQYDRQSAGSHAQDQAGEENRGGQDAAIDEKATFRSWLQGGMQALSPEQRQFMQKRINTSNEVRAFSSGTDNTGGHTVAEDFLNRLEIAMKQWGGMLEVAEVLRTDTGAALPMPTLNLTNEVATIIGENVQSGLDTTTPFGVASLGAYTYRTPVLPISYEFLQDSSFGEGTIVDAFGEQLGRGLNAHLTTGDGSGKPEGIVPASVSGKVGATGQTATIIYDDLVDLEHSVDPAYRANARFMFHDNSLKVIKKLKDADGLPLFVPDVSSAVKNTILGYQYQINQDMAAMAANAKSVLFGRLDKYKVRMVRDMTMLRLVERYADFLQVGFIGFLRADGKLLDAGTNPVKFYQNSAT